MDAGDGGGARTPWLRVRLFGRFEAARVHEASGAETPLELSQRRADRLLAFLLLRKGRAERCEISETLWPEAATNPLDHSLRLLREQLGDQAGRLETRQQSVVRLDLNGVDCDVLAFDAEIARAAALSGAAEEGGAADAARERAVARYGGSLLAFWREEPTTEIPWLETERARRAAQCQEALWALAMRARRANDGAREADWLRLHVRYFPRRDRGWRALIRTLAEAGDALEAVEVYTRYQAALRQLDQRPAPEFTALYRELLERAEVPPATDEGGAATGPGTIGGALPPDTPLYVERDADARVATALARRESIVLLIGPRETGKSSLAARALARAGRGGTLTLHTDFQSLARADLESAPALYRALTEQLADQVARSPLALPPPTSLPLAAATAAAAAAAACAPSLLLERFVQSGVLARAPQGVVWCLDSVDRLFECPGVRDDFFALLRSWHEKRAYPSAANRAWQHLSLVVACATEARLYIRDLNQSPFNVGVRVELGDFDPAQAARLHTLCRTLDGDDPSDSAARAALYELLGGHPYLTRRALAWLAEGENTGDVTAFLASADRDDGPLGSHLRRLAEPIVSDPALSEAVGQALAGRPCHEEAFFRLRSAGVLSGLSAQDPRPRCALYARYFGRRLTRAA